MTDDIVILEGTDWRPALPVRLGVLDDDAHFAFSNGQCHAFATALAEATGGEVVWGGREECHRLSGGGEYGDTCEADPLPSGLCPCQVDHVLVLRGDDEYLDVSGAWVVEDLLDDAMFEIVAPLDAGDLAALATHPWWRPPALEAARALVPVYLAWLDGGPAEVGS